MKNYAGFWPRAAAFTLLKPDSVSFVITGQMDTKSGAEDFACAEYFQGLLKGLRTDPAPNLDHVYKSREAAFHPGNNFPAFPKSDLDYCINIDAFDFAMPVTKANGRHISRAVKPT